MIRNRHMWLWLINYDWGCTRIHSDWQVESDLCPTNCIAGFPMMNRVVVKGIFRFSMLVSMVVDDGFGIVTILNWLTCMHIHAHVCTPNFQELSLSLSLSFFPKSPKLAYHYFPRSSVNFCRFFNLNLKSLVQFKVSSSIYCC